MKGIILAAGYATRLHPLTKTKSKCLIEIKGKPIIRYIIDKMEKISEIDRIYIVANHKFAVDFEYYVKNLDSKKEIVVIDDQTESNDDRLGAVGDIAYVIEDTGIDDDLLVVAGDNLFESPLTKFANFCHEKNTSCVGSHKFRSKKDIAEKFGVLETDAADKIIGFEEKPKEPKTNLVATACYLFTKEDVKEIIDYKAKGNPLDNSGEFIKYLSEKKDIYSFVFKEKWYDIGSFEDLGRAREEFKG